MVPSAPRHWPVAFETVNPCGNRGLTESCTNFDQSCAVTGPRAHAVPKYSVSWTESCSPGLQPRCCGETQAATANDIAAALKAGKRSVAPTLSMLRHLEQPGRAHTAADAHGGHHVLDPATLAFDQRMPHET